MRWINLEPIMQSEVSKEEKDKYHVLIHIYMKSRNMVMYMFQCYFLKSSPFSFPHCVQKSILYVCISIAAL